MGYSDRIVMPDWLQGILEHVLSDVPVISEAQMGLLFCLSLVGLQSSWEAGLN